MVPVHLEMTNSAIEHTTDLAVGLCVTHPGEGIPHTVPPKDLQERKELLGYYIIKKYTLNTVIFLSEEGVMAEEERHCPAQKLMR